MRRRTTRLLLACGLCALTAAAAAQPAMERVGETLSVLRPRIALAPDGSSALAWEAYRQLEFIEQWQIAVQRFAPDGTPVGPTAYFEPESCSSLDIWSGDFMEHVELEFQPGGALLVLMQHGGEFSLLGQDGVISSEATLGALDANGQVYDLHSSGSCVQDKLIFPGAGEQDRPRMAVLPSGAVLVTLDGFFDDSDLRNVAIRALAPDGSELIEQIIPHDDPASQQAFHWYPDVAASGVLILFVWQACPVIDNQGNAEECNVEGQFARVSGEALEAVGGNITVNAGDPPGTLSVWPSAAMNAGGRSVVVWADTRTGAQGDVFAQLFDANAQAVGSNVQVSVGDGILIDRPEVAMLDDGRFRVVWTDSTAGAYRARGRTFDAAGIPLTEAQVLEGRFGYQSGQPAVASNGQAFVSTWIGGPSASSWGIVSSHLGLVVNREPVPEAPPRPSLQPYPEPFTDAATLVYTLPEAGRVRLVVYDLLGREVARLVDGERAAGRHHVSFGEGLTAGRYLVRLTAGGAQVVRGVTRIR